MSDIELKPCPFCGCEPSDDPDVEQVQTYAEMRTGVAHVYCERCGAEGPHEHSRVEAATAWNTRAPDPSLQSKLAEAERVSAVDAFEMGFVFANALQGQALEDSRAVGRLLSMDAFEPISERIREVEKRIEFNPFTDADQGIVAAKKIIHAALATIREEEPLPAKQGE